MLNAYGWCVVRASREPYRDVTPDGDAIDKLDEQLDSEDAKLSNDLAEWLNESAPGLQWTLNHRAWSDARVVLYSVSRNHRASHLWDFLDWVVANAPGSYGLTFVHDDEDVPGNRTYGRGDADHSNEFRVFRIANGKIEEFDDPFLSPLVPTINPTEYS